MSNHQFIVTDLDFQQLQPVQDIKSLDAVSIIKEEELHKDELFYFSQSDVSFTPTNFEIVENMGNTVSIPDSSNFTIPFTDEQMNQLLMSGSSGEDGFGKMPIDFGNMLKMNGMKAEQSNVGNTSHFVKYRSDENGKHVKIWECGICHKEFGHQYILMRHLPTHTDERKFQCKQCGKAFRQMSTLSQHRAIHSKLRPYICEVCQKTFNRVSTLISHRKTHTGLKPHRCHLCNKAFHQKGNLRNHVFTHTNERPYKCDVCQKGFNQMSNLMCHKFKPNGLDIPLAIPPFDDNICGIAEHGIRENQTPGDYKILHVIPKSQRLNLLEQLEISKAIKAHQRADKPKYNCQTCGKEFDKRISLRNHEQYEHGDATTSASGVLSPRLKYSNGILVAPINTVAMKHAIATNQVPFALLRPLNGIPVLVRVLPAGDKQMLVPATAEDLKKFGDITIKKKEEAENDTKDVEIEDKEDENSAVITSEASRKGATVQIRIPVVASVTQRCRDGAVHMDIESPGPRKEGQDDSFIFTTTDEEFNKVGLSKEPTSLQQQLQFFEISSLSTEEEKDKLFLQDENLSNNSMSMFDTDMVLNLSAPMVQNDVVMQDMMLNGGGDDSRNADIYEVIDTSAEASLVNSDVELFPSSSHDDEFELCVD